MNKMLSTVLLALIGGVTANANATGPVAEDGDWVAHFYDEQEYFKGIDHYIDFNQTATRFQLIQAFLQGYHQGLYREDAFKVDPDCFGERFVHKLNEYEYMWYGDPFGSFYENIIPELSMTFQFYHMIF